MKYELVPKDHPSIIKVIGVGGGGSNAVNHMYKLGIRGVDFIVCNTDAQALEISPVPHKIQLGASLTEGRGAGSIPEVGKQSAIENIEEIKALLRDNTKMVFITAGMGGGTGTGAAPIIAGVAREMDILTVGIVTIPFGFEGRKRKLQAEAGIEDLKKNVDTLLIICNDRVREIHGNLKLQEAFGHADNILSTAAKSIAEIISVTLHINVDFADVQTVMKDSGVAIMGSAQASGNSRAIKAVEMALDSPLLNDNNIEGARYILLNITSGNTEITMDEMGEITDYIQEKAGQSAEVIMGVGQDDSLGDNIGVTIIATGFKTRERILPENAKKPEKIVYDLNDTPAPDYDNIKPLAEEKTNEPVLKTVEAELPVTAVIKDPITAQEKKFSHPFLAVKKNIIAEPPAVAPETNVATEVPVAEILTETEEAVETVNEIIAEEQVEIKENDFEEIVPVADASEISPELPQNITSELVTETVEETILPINSVDEIIEQAAIEIEVAETGEAPLMQIEEAAAEIENEIVLLPSESTEVTYATSEKVAEKEILNPENEKPEEVIEIPRTFEFTNIPQPVIEAVYAHDEPETEEAPVPEAKVENKTEITITPIQQEIKQPPAAEPTKQPAPAAQEEKPKYSTAPVASEEEIFKRTRDRLERLKQLSFKISSGNISDLEKEPAYKRRNVQLNDVPSSSGDSNISRTSLGDAAADNKTGLKPNNTFLHDRVD